MSLLIVNSERSFLFLSNALIVDSNSVILNGLFVAFPIMYILLGLVCTDLKK